MRTLMIPSLAVAIAVASAACGPQAGSLQAANDALGATQVNSDRVLGNRTLVSVRSGAGTGHALAAIRRQQLYRHRELRDPGRAGADDPQADDRAGPRPAGAGRAEARSVRERDDGVESRGAGRRRTEHAARRAAAAGGRRRARHGDLDDAARVPESGRGQQRDVHAERRRLGSDVHGGQEQVRRHDQRAERGDARPDLDRQSRPRRHRGAVHVLRLQGLRRRAVPGSHPSRAGRASGAGPHGLRREDQQRRPTSRYRPRPTPLRRRSPPPPRSSPTASGTSRAARTTASPSIRRITSSSSRGRRPRRDRSR